MRLKPLTDSVRALADLLVPRRCLVCGALLGSPEDVSGNDLPGAETHRLSCFLCPSCAEDLPQTWFWTWDGNPVQTRLWQRVGIVHGASLCFYRHGTGYAEMLQAVKYGGNLRLGRALGQMLGERMRGAGRYLSPQDDPVTGTPIPGIQAVVPVPLHLLRSLKRGYNQAEVIARGLAETLAGIPVVTGLLRRRRYTRTQTRLTGDGRKENVRGAFAVKGKAVRKLQAAGIRHILVVDDILTTGATLSEAVKPLLPHFYVSVATVGFVE